MNKFQLGDIIRLKADKSVVHHIDNIEHKSSVDTSGRYDETYYWTEYQFDDGTIVKDYDDRLYELVSREIGPAQIRNFDKVIVKNGIGLEGERCWKCDLAAGWTNESQDCEKRLMTISQPNVKEEYHNILPYNEETKKLIGTNSDMPGYYHYPIWVEDRLKAIKEFPDGWASVEDIRIDIEYNSPYV